MKKLKKLKKLHMVLLLILTAVLGVLGLQGIRAKYTTSVSVRGNVTFSAELAESLNLYEHKAERLPDGSYKLSEKDLVGTVADPGTGELTKNKGNEYMVMPGVDIPKDPQIEITGKSALDSYLYVEIEDSLAQSDASDSIKKTIQYELTDEWLKLDGVTGPNGTTSKPTSVYVYKGTGNTPMILDETFTPVDNSVTPSKETTKIIKILKDDTITVGENYSSADFMLNIYAHLLQIPQDAEETPDAKKIFTAQLPQTTKMMISRAVNFLNIVSTEEEDDVTTTSEDVTNSGANVKETSNEEIEYVTITIHYMAEDIDTKLDIQVFDDYVATLRAGTEFSTTVESPTYPGYAPYLVNLDNTLKDASEIELSYAKDELQSDVEIAVDYLPIEVPYIARYYLQNVSDDSYSEYKVVTGEALTGSYPTEDLDIEIPGFKILYHEPDRVAADGSTEFICRYNREYYLYMFDCAGGYGVDPIYARYETPIAVPNPVKPGYTFLGWDKDGDGVQDDNAVPDKIGLGDASFTAIWTPTPGACSYTVCYWTENADSTDETNLANYSYAGSKVYYNATVETLLLRADQNHIDGLSDNNVLGDEAKYFTFNPGLGSDIAVEGDGSTILNVYFTRNEYTINYYYARSYVDGENTKYEIPNHTGAFSDAVDLNETTFGNGNGSQYWTKIYEVKTADDNANATTENSANGTYGEAMVKKDENGNFLYTPSIKEITISNKKYNYYYFSITAKYGANLGDNIGDQWPTAPLELKTLLEGVDSYKFVSWATRKGSIYYEKETNKNIKGLYSQLDERIIIDSSNNVAHNMLAYWNPNPKNWLYRTYISCAPGEEPDLIVGTEKYRFYQNYFLTSNQSEIEHQGALGLVGYEFAKSISGTAYVTINGTQAEVEFTEGRAISNDETIEDEKYLVGLFLYNRNKHTLDFINQDEYLYTGSETVYGSYGENLSTYKEKAGVIENNPTAYYPSNLEPGAYEFEGWYTAPEGNGTKIDFNTTTLTMPDSKYAVYAYWKPKEYTVRFYDHYKDYQAGTSTAIATYTNIEHSTYLTSYDNFQEPTPSASDLGSANYTPIGWFYISEEGEKERFNTGSMVITEDLHLFMEWESDEVVPYTISYVTTDASGNEIEIAPKTTGYSYSGLTKTFTAKCGEELYSEYKSGYYPNYGSHSILMTEEIDGNNFKFVYTYASEVSYTVQYIKESDGTYMVKDGLTNPQTYTTSKSVLTEKFEVFSGYIPDAYYKRLVLSIDSSKNIITFYYTEDNDHAYYAVNHEIEDGTNSDGSIKYKTYASITGIADLKDVSGNPNKITEKALSINGYSVDIEKTEAKATEMAAKGSDYSVDAAKGDVTGTVVESGLEMYIYYKKNNYPYEIQFKEYGTEKELHDSYIGNGKYGDSVNVDMANFVGFNGSVAQDLRTIKKDNIEYNLVSNSTRTFTIRSNETGSEQIITFYYKAKEVRINYQAVCREAISNVDFGYVSISSELITSVQNIGGSTPMSEKGYRFVNWYVNGECTTKVNASWVDANGRLIPQELPQEDEITYYALFEPILSKLTIVKAGNNVSNTDTFLFRVKGEKGGTANIDLTVSITGTGSVTINNLPIGTYTVTELEDWSWRYTADNSVPASASVTISEGPNSTVTFKNNANSKAWLGGESIKENPFAAFTPTT